MWDLTRAGYRIVAFIHDEFLIEVSDQADFDHLAADVSRICTAAMQPLVPGIPVPCEYALMQCWSKQATECRDLRGKLIPWNHDPSIPF